MKKNKAYITAITIMLGMLATCGDWTNVEPVDYKVVTPGGQDDGLWAMYTAALREYKASEHFLAYAIFDNAPEKPGSEKDFMRCLPDSLDMVSLTNADNLSPYDIEDLALMREKGTLVLCRIDYASRAAEFAGAAALGAYLDKVISMVEKHLLDGFSFTGIPLYGEDATAQAEAAALILSKLSPLAGPGKAKRLVFEGDPVFIAAADRDKIDYFALDTGKNDNVTDVKMQVHHATGFAGVPKSKILLTARSQGSLYDEDKTEFPAIGEMARRVVTLGPLAGLAISEIGMDYFGTDMNYRNTRMAIQALNPAK